ncbi:MAG: GNAT family N-acetyltransferase [Acidimicrobiales bacterium]|nr:GNAT family N-acetyltransferase [Acidimicrobiales bacterium]
MKKLDVLHYGNDRLRVGTWRGDASIAYVAPLPGDALSDTTIDTCTRRLAADGFGSALTSALTVAEQEPFVRCGWTVRERLHLLRHHLGQLPAVGGVARGRMRRARWGDRTEMLDVDRAAFDAFWRFDEAGLADARSATPTVRVRVVDDGGVLAYAITGRAGPTGYLQRLAVHPDAAGQGLGTALVLDALHWSARRGADGVLVNTQESNRRAMELYLRLGFVPQPSGLAVLGIDLAAPA